MKNSHGFAKSPSQVRILVVDDNVLIRGTLTAIFDEAGYSVLSAADGFSALSQIRRGAPDLLISDLNMPGMSGFELLSVVRRRFPQIGVIAMSGSFCGSEMPPTVAADAFYEKGRTDLTSLLQLAHVMAGSGSARSRVSSVPIWISTTPLGRHHDGDLVITCPECLRVFSQPLSNSTFVTGETRCLHCSSPVELALVQSVAETGSASVQVP